MKKGQKKIDLLKYFFPIIIIISSFFLYLNFQFLVQNPIIFVLIPIWTISLSFAYSKKNIRKERIFTWLILITFLVIYFNFYASPFIIFAATPTPSPPSVSHSPEPQKGGSAITFSSNAAPGAAGEWIKLLICKNNTAGCVLNSQWGYRKPITISNSGSSALTDYQVNVMMDTEGLINMSVAKRSATGTSASSIATSYPYQRKSFYAKGLFWVFFFNGSYMVYSTSTDGITWSSPIAVRPVLDGEGFSIFFDGTYVHYAASYSTVLYYRRGTPNTDGSITWDTEQTAASGYTFRGPVIAIDSNGLPWIGYLRDDGANYYTFITSSTSSPTWNTRSGHPFQLGTTSYYTARAVPVPLTGGEVYVIYNRPNEGRLWNGTVWSSAEALDLYTLEQSTSVVAIGGDVHYVYTRTYPTWAIMYRKRTYGIGWENAVILQDNVPSTNTPFPTLTLEPVTNSLYVFWAGSPTANHIFYKKNVNGSWSNLPIDLITESTSITRNNGITSFYQVYSNKIGLIYMTETTSPYNVIFAYLTGNKMRLDCGDIRFTDSDGSTLLNYWIESGCNSANTKIWVKVPSIPASSTKTIYVYYGNPSAASASNATNTMLWYDDFDDKTVGQVPSGWTTSGGTWAVSTDTSVSGTKSLKQSTVTVYGPNPHIYVSSVSIDNVSVEAKIRLNGQRQMGVLARRTSSNTFYFWEIELDDQRITLRRFVSGSSTILATFSYSVSANQWYKLRLDVVGNSLKGYLDDIIRASVTDTGITAPGNVGVHDNIEVDTNPHYVDDFIVRKLASPEPTTSVGAEEVPPTSNFIYTQSSAVSSNPSATYTCPSCQYSNNTYYGVAYSVNESVWTAFTTAKAFVCKMEVSQAGSCSCSSNTQCYNPCNINWGTYYDGYCYNSKCYDAIPGSAFGLSQSCLAGTILNHETSSQRYANVNGRLYYCKGSDNSVSPYPFVFSISPGSLAGNCKCLSDGKWACPTGIIPIRGGRIKII
jgi:hypothetical protein